VIPSQNVEVQILLVGFTSEPNVFFDRTSINFKSVLVGRQLKEFVKIKNLESTPFAFSFDGTGSEGRIVKRDAAVRFTPSNGVVPAFGDTTITVTFLPQSERSYNYNATCYVRKKPGALVLNVKGDGYEIQEKITAEAADSSTFELIASPGVDNVIDFGLAQINERKCKRIIISNHGKVAFDFRWSFETKSNGFLYMQPEYGSVGKDERAICDLVFLPTAPTQLKPTKMQCAITNGRTFSVSVYGVGRRPPLRFSQTEHDFGPCFLVRKL
jgi:hydrocephalus-inducing protein